VRLCAAVPPLVVSVKKTSPQPHVCVAVLFREEKGIQKDKLESW